MPKITVNGYPFLFTGSTIPGVSPMAVRNGTVYYYSPCARGIYSFPLASLSDNRQPYQRAADIQLVAPTPADIQVEELLDFTFNPFDPTDPNLYAAHGLQLEVSRLNRYEQRGGPLALCPNFFKFPRRERSLTAHGGRND